MSLTEVTEVASQSSTAPTAAWPGSPPQESPPGDEAAALIHALLAAVEERQEVVAAYYLGEAAAAVSVQERATRIWLPVLDAMERPAHNGGKIPVDGMVACLTLLRRQSRVLLKTGRATAATQWIVPEPGGLLLGTVAHVAAACLSLKGVDARPWLWSTAPTIGSLRMVTPAWHRSRRVSTPKPANAADLTWDDLVQTVRAHLQLIHQPLLKGTSC